MSVSSKIRDADKAKVLGEDFVEKHEKKANQLNEVYNFLQGKISEFRKAGFDVFFAESKLKVAKPKIAYYKASMDEKDYKKALDSLLEIKNEIREIIQNKKEQEHLKQKLKEDEEKRMQEEKENSQKKDDGQDSQKENNQNTKNAI